MALKEQHFTIRRQGGQHGYHNRLQDGHFNWNDNQGSLEMAVDDGIPVTEIDKHLAMLLGFYNQKTLHLGQTEA